MACKLAFLLWCSLLIAKGYAQELPGVYEYYSEGGISSGLTEDGEEFLLNGKLIHILSGSIHYFRVHPDYWRDRLRKLRAAGFNTVDTYVSWAMHEKKPDEFDFSGWLDVRRFIEMAREEDLLVMLRPGPYICSEFDYGGLPPWLLQDTNMKIRSSYEGYEARASVYLNAVLSRLHDLQWSEEFGAQPIIAMQVENEYGAFGFGNFPRDTEHLLFLLDEMKITNQFNHVLYFTSDSPASTADLGSIPGVLQMINFRTTGNENFEALEELQPGRPKMVAEYWTGWFDHWTEPYHSVTNLEGFEDGVNITFQNQASINYYMFHGGSTHGFWSGANVDSGVVDYLPTINSYDYNAPLSEAGDYTEKYYRTIELLKFYNRGPEFYRPALPDKTIKTVYPSVQPMEYLSMIDLISQSTHKYSDVVVNMEELDQNHGFIVYTQQQISLPSPISTLKIEGHIRDIAYIFVDEVLISRPIDSQAGLQLPGFWPRPESTWRLKGDDSEHRIDIVVEALGRTNYGNPNQFDTRKGLWEGQVFLNDAQLTGWTITSLEFLDDWMESLSDWKAVDGELSGSNLLRTTFEIDAEPNDTWLDLRAQGFDKWIKGVVWINGFNLGRYWNVGPTQTMFIPAPLLHQGLNEIRILEIYHSGSEITFTDKPDLGPPQCI